MIAHRRADVADLNAPRPRAPARAPAASAPTSSTTGDRAFAVGDRVVATRNDRRLGVVNGQTGHARPRSATTRLTVELDDGRTRRAARAATLDDGHLDHGYAITAHRAQGATVDRTFVLGSDELYREWGYTALSRHRDEARFYVTATPGVPQPGARAAARPTTTSPARVARMLDDSRAEHLALHGLTPDHVAEAARRGPRPRAARSSTRSRRGSPRCRTSATRPAGTSAAAATELDGILAGHARAQSHWRERVDELDAAARRAPRASRAARPLARRRPARRERRRLEPDLALPEPDLAPDVGLDLGP